MPLTRASFGPASLSTALAGIFFPAGLAVCVFLFLKPPFEPYEIYPDEQGPAFGGCLAILVTLEVVAFVCGLCARHTRSGKVGLLISGFFLLVLLLLLIAVIVYAILLGIWFTRAG